ncbi:MAG: hypothetical protein QGI83_04005 [Candidatus Latescibacteria bacterium]|jgi:hypothetical protein|nr:hypothetical protein [Candidatus Latescibacterota bacterium]
MVWKKGRGRLGILDPLLGTWVAETESERGPVRCVRTFERVLEGKYVQLTAEWQQSGSAYEEIALIGVGDDKKVCFWSFTSDGKRSNSPLKN